MISRIIYFASISLLSCTEREAVKDKFPDIPFFPESSNEKYVFEKKHFKGANRLQNFIIKDDGTMYGDTVVLFDLTTGTLEKVCIEGQVQYFDKFRGAIISQKDDLTFLRYTAPSFQREALPYKNFDGLYDSVEQKNPLVSESKIWNIVDSIQQVQFQTYSCMGVFFDRQHYLLQSEERDLVIDARGVDPDLTECLHSQRSPFPESMLNSFDQVILGYSFSGSNHFALGVERDELFYYKIFISHDTVKFKYRSQYFQIYKTSNHSTLVIDAENNMYELKPKAD